ncbi:hypothetical protein B4U80_14154 [Leptotrombidium deliense]|uniref:Terpene synthase n=1 Tax=Leptotrombidium deliense TaxID=299467 RepID=A0A443S1E0_9ACAR|nr:hypothetical protein B4U80_14154 [Leptotrombidium deliense]
MAEGFRQLSRIHFICTRRSADVRFRKTAPLGKRIDDVCDNISSNESIKRVLNLYDCLLANLNDCDFHTTMDESDDHFENAIRDMFADFKPYFANKSIQKRINELLQSSEIERKASKKKSVLKLYEYENVRNFTIGINVLIAAYNFLTNVIPLDSQDGQLHHETLTSVNKIGYIYNDLVSLEKEIKEKSTSNLIIVLKQERKYEKWQFAIDEAVQMLKDELKLFELLLTLTWHLVIDLYNDEFMYLLIIYRIK